MALVSYRTLVFIEILNENEKEVLGLYYKNSVSKENTAPAAISSIQTFGDFLGFNLFTYFVLMAVLKIMGYFMRQAQS